jgi:hypothetical protein
VTDPGTRARLETYYAEHPMLREQAQAEAWELEKRSLLLLEREDAGPLYLSPEEVVPWLKPLRDRLEPIETLALQAATEGRVDDAQLRHEMGPVLAEISQEMAASVFTPERIEQLAETLRTYQRQLLEAGENQAARYAQGGLLALEHEPSPPDNPFLIGICLVSLRATFLAVSEKAAAERQQSKADK